MGIPPGRGDTLLPLWKVSPNGKASAAMENDLPRRGGEGRGEGERFFPLNYSGLGSFRDTADRPSSGGLGRGVGNGTPEVQKDHLFLPMWVRRAGTFTGRTTIIS